jgi:hypothetical protein
VGLVIATTPLFTFDWTLFPQFQHVFEEKEETLDFAADKLPASGAHWLRQEGGSLCGPTLAMGRNYRQQPNPQEYKQTPSHGRPIGNHTDGHSRPEGAS